MAMMPVPSGFTPTEGKERNRSAAARYPWEWMEPPTCPPGHRRLNDEVFDAVPGARQHGSVYAAPQQPAGERHLVHPCVVGVDHRHGLADELTKRPGPVLLRLRNKVLVRADGDVRANVAW